MKLLKEKSFLMKVGSANNFFLWNRTVSKSNVNIEVGNVEGLYIVRVSHQKKSQKIKNCLNLKQIVKMLSVQLNWKGMLV